MKVVFWLSLSIVFYTYAVYPLLMRLLALILPRPWITADITPSVSIVLAVHNGAEVLQGKIRHLVDLDYPDIREIIVVSDGSTDGTEMLLANVDHPLVRAIIHKEHQGKAAAVNAGVAEATGELVVFVDIRPRIAPGALRKLVRSFADPEVGCANGELVLLRDGHTRTAAAFGGMYWRYEKWIRSSEATFDSPVGVYGGFYAVRRALAVRMPGGTILDDMFQPLSIIRKGYRVIYDSKSCVHDIWPRTTGEEFQRKVRTLAGNFQLLQLAPWTITPKNRVLFQIISHKYMRLVVPYLLLLMQFSSLALFTESRFFAVAAIFQMLVWTTSIAALRYRLPLIGRIAVPASAILVLNAAAVMALFAFLFTRGPLWKMWKPTSVEAGIAPEDALRVAQSKPQTDVMTVG